jgi:hypothetical protein
MTEKTGTEKTDATFFLALIIVMIIGFVVSSAAHSEDTAVPAATSSALPYQS